MAAVLSSALLLGPMTATRALGAPPSDGPVALVGEGYGVAEAKAVAERVLDMELPALIHESVEGRLPAEDFGKYRAVVVTGALTEPYNVEESLRIDNYVREGGRLILIQQAPKNFRVEDVEMKDRDSSYLFGRSYYKRQGPICAVNNASAPLLQGAFEESPDPFWLEGNVMVRGSEWENLIGTDEFVLVGELSRGHGKVYYFGHELFRLISRAKRDGKEPEVTGWVRMLTNALQP